MLNFLSLFPPLTKPFKMCSALGYDNFLSQSLSPVGDIKKCSKIDEKPDRMANLKWTSILSGVALRFSAGGKTGSHRTNRFKLNFFVTKTFL